MRFLRNDEDPTISTRRRINKTLTLEEELLFSDRLGNEKGKDGIAARQVTVWVCFFAF